MTTNRAPRERRALQAQLCRPLAREVERPVAPSQGISDRVRCGVGQHRQHEGLGVPERVAVIAGTGQPLGGDRALLSPCARLQDVEQAEPQRLLELGISVELDIGAVPEVVQVVGPAA